MAENDVAHGKFLQHAGANFAGERAEIVFAHVLRAQPDVGIVNDGLGHRFQRRERRAHHDVHLLDVGQFQFQVADQGQRLGHRFVHLPVARNDQFSFFIHILNHPRPRSSVLESSITRTTSDDEVEIFTLSVSAATPGRTAPSRNSRLAPPPVLINVTLSPSLALFSAFTLSPPPMMLLAPSSAWRPPPPAPRRWCRGKALVLKHAHRPVPQNRFRALDDFGVMRGSFLTDAKPFRVVGNICRSPCGYW